MVEGAAGSSDSLLGLLPFVFSAFFFPSLVSWAAMSTLVEEGDGVWFALLGDNGRGGGDIEATPALLAKAWAFWQMLSASAEVALVLESREPQLQMRGEGK